MSSLERVKMLGIKLIPKPLKPKTRRLAAPVSSLHTRVGVRHIPFGVCTCRSIDSCLGQFAIRNYRFDLCIALVLRM